MGIMNSLPGNVLLIAGSAADVPTVLEFLSAAGIPTESNQDLYVRHFRQFGIDDAQELRARASARAMGQRRVFVISAGGMTSEAQNALLKIFEEPTKDTIFFVLTPSAQFFLPTLLSRVVCISAENGENDGEARKFVKMNYADRLSFVAAVVKEMKDDDEKKDPQRAQRLIEDLIKYFYEQKRTPENVRVLELAMKYREYAHNNAPSYKQMLEHLALVVPADTKYA